jgi:hypothetical protein
VVDQADGGNDQTGSGSLAAGRGFWLTWVLASAAGWAVGGAIGAAVGSSREPFVAGFVVVAAGGVLAGMLQSLVLRRQVAAAGWWAVATIGAMAAVGVLVIAVGVVDAGVGAAASGTVLGVVQWLVLRRRVAQAGWWVLASTVGWVVGGFLSGAFEGGVAGWTTIGAVYGAITGAALVWLLRHQSPGSDQPSSAPPDMGTWTMN